jgi:TonB family protein
VVCLISLEFCLTPAVADERLPAKVRINLLLTSLTYDHNLQNRCPDGLRIGVVALAGNSSSLAEANETYSAIQAVAGKKIKGLGFHVDKVTVSSVQDLKSSVASKKLNTLYIASGFTDLLGPVVEMARKNKIVLIAGEPEYVPGGVAIGAVKRDQKPKLLVHVESAVAQGANFDARLLRLAEVVQPAPRYQAPDVVKKRRVAGADPEYPKIAREARLEAKLVVKIYISPDGTVGKLKFLKTHAHFEEVVREAIQTWRFKPHTINGRPIGTYTVYKFDFKLD